MTQEVSPEQKAVAKEEVRKFRQLYYGLAKAIERKKNFVVLDEALSIDVDNGNPVATIVFTVELVKEGKKEGNA